MAFLLTYHKYTWFVLNTKKPKTKTENKIRMFQYYNFFVNIEFKVGPHTLKNTVKYFQVMKGFLVI